MILSAPPDMPELNQLYSKLQELYPEAVQYFKIKFEESRKQQAFLAPQQNQPPPQQHSLHQQLPPQPQPQSQPSLQQQQGLQLLLMFRLNLCNNKVSPTIYGFRIRSSNYTSKSSTTTATTTAANTTTAATPTTISTAASTTTAPQQPQQLQQPQQPQQSQSFDDLLLTDGFNPSSDSLGGTGPGDFNPNYNNGSFQLSTLSLNRYYNRPMRIHLYLKISYFDINFVL